MVHVVVDTKGAERIAAIDPAYFRMMSMPLNAVNPIAVDWLSASEKRDALRSA